MKSTDKLIEMYASTIKDKDYVEKERNALRARKIRKPKKKKSNSK